MEQVYDVGHTTIVQNAWTSGRRLAVHGIVYGLADGLLRDLAVRVTGPEPLEAVYRVRAGRPAG